MVKVRLPELKRATEELRRRADDLRKARDELVKRSRELKRLEEEWRKKVKIREEIESFRKEFQKHIITFITGAFAFVAALTWNDLIKETIHLVVPPSKELFYRYLIALGITLIAIIIIYLLSKLKVKEDKA